MATQYPPAELSVYDPGNVPEVFVDGVAYYVEEKGIVRTGFYVLEPILPVVGDDEPPKMQAILCFRFRCTVATQRLMKAQVIRVQRLTEPLMSMAVVAGMLS